MPYIVDFDSDPYADQLMLGIYGYPGSGKTEFIMELARGRNDFVYIISMDRGDSRTRVSKMQKDRVRGRIKIIRVEPHPNDTAAIKAWETSPAPFTSELYATLKLVVNQMIPAVIAKGVPPGRIWLVLDTVTAMQQKLLREGSDQQITGGNPLTFRAKMAAGRGKKEMSLPDRIKGQLLTTPEWGANLAIMSSVVDYVARVPINIVFNMLLKEEKDEKGKVQRSRPAIQGASYQKVVGDVDVLMWVTKDAAGKHIIRTQATPKWEGKDRFGVLPEKLDFVRLEDGAEVPCLRDIRQRIFDQDEG